VRRQGELLGVSRAALYDEPRPESTDNRRLRRLLDAQDTRTPYYGIRRRAAWLRSQGDQVNHQRLQRLLRLMGLEALDPKPHLSRLGAGQRIYPSLRRGVNIARVNQVWSTAITSIRLLHGVVYAVAILDWCSRDVLAWEISVTLDHEFCLSALARALAHGQPEIVNADQGVPFTSAACTERLKVRGIRISRDGQGRALDNIVVERWWRPLKDEEVDLHEYRSVPEAIRSLGRYVAFDNSERLPQARHDQTPEAVPRQRAQARASRFPP
jgi:putative transposase